MKKFLLPTLQIFITVCLLGWIFRDPEKNKQIWESLQKAQFDWLALGFLAIGITFLLQTGRWVLLLRVQGIEIRYARAWQLVMIGAFFNFFLLGSTGGDVMKIFYAMRETATKKSAAFLSVMIDRMVGLLALVVVTTVICFLNFQQLTADAMSTALLTSIVIILGASVFIILAGFVVDRCQLAHKIPHTIPFHARIIEFASAFSIYARDGRTLLATFCISIPAHLLSFSCFYCTAQAFSANLSLMNIFSVMPIINTISALPISLSGMGIREQLFQQMFHTLFGTPENISVLISLAGFSLMILWGLTGGLIYLFYRPSGIHLGDMKQEVSRVEDLIEHGD